MSQDDLDRYPSFMTYKSCSRDVFMLYELARLSSNDVFLDVNCDGNIQVSYIPLGKSPSIGNVIVPYVPVDPHSWSSIEFTGLADNFEQYIDLALISNVGSLHNIGTEKMFPNISKEMLLINADMYYDANSMTI